MKYLVLLLLLMASCERDSMQCDCFKNTYQDKPERKKISNELIECPKDYDDINVVVDKGCGEFYIITQYCY